MLKLPYQTNPRPFLTIRAYLMFEASNFFRHCHFVSWVQACANSVANCGRFFLWKISFVFLAQKWAVFFFQIQIMLKITGHVPRFCTYVTFAENWVGNTERVTTYICRCFSLGNLTNLDLDTLIKWLVIWLIMIPCELQLHCTYLLISYTVSTLSTCIWQKQKYEWKVKISFVRIFRHIANWLLYSKDWFTKV